MTEIKKPQGGKFYLVHNDLLSLSQAETTRYNIWENYKEWLCAGAEITRSLDLLRQEFDDRLNNGGMITFANTHPHDYLRLKAIRSSPEYKYYCGNSLLGKSFSTFTEGLLDNMFEKKENGEYKLRNFRA